MSKSYLEVTYRQGKPFAAYLYLERVPGDKAVRTDRHDNWLVDFAADGRAIGIEFMEIRPVNLTAINAALVASHQPMLSIDDIRPLEAA